jgi:hypothetical protein
MTGRWAVAFGARAPVAGGSFAIGPATAHLSRYPAHLGLRWRWRLAPLAGSIEGGGVASMLRVGEDGFSKTTRVEGGARVSATAHIDTGSIAPYVGIFSEWIPWTYPLALAPDGPLTHTPSVWIGVAAGMSLSFD